MKLIKIEQVENVFTITNLCNGMVVVEVREKSPTNTIMKFGGAIRKLNETKTFKFTPAQYPLRKNKPLYIKAVFGNEVENSQITIQ